MLTSKECIKEIKAALKQFGEYSYYDKRSYEVMDMNVIVERTKDMNGKQIADMLSEVAKYEHGEVFVQDMMSMLGDRDDLDALYSDKRLARYY